MASSTGLWDLSGGSSKATQLPTGTTQQSGTTRSTGSSSASRAQSEVSVVDSRNTPQFALSALEQLINQLSDRPNISDAELDRLAPLPNQADFIKYDNLGNATNPNYVPRLDKAAYEKALAAAQAKRQEIIRNAPVIEGGTPSTRADSAARRGAIESAQGNVSAFSKEAAFEDAGALSARFTRQLLEEIMPQITRAAESSGTSGGAVRGLLAQDAAARVAEAQAALGLQAATQFGQIANQSIGLIELLTRAGSDPTLNLLLQAVGLARGTVNQGTSFSSGTQSATQTSTDTKDVNQTADQIGFDFAANAERVIGGVPRLNVSASTPNFAEATVNRPGRNVITEDDLAVLNRSGVSSRLSNFTF